MKKSTYFRTALPLFLLLLLVCQSCEHKDLCLDHFHDRISIHFDFDWQDAPDASPASMSLYLLPHGGGEALRYEFTDKDGGAVSVPAGKYDAVAFNSDSETHMIHVYGSGGDFEICLRDAISPEGMGLHTLSLPKAVGADGERLAIPPDPLWVACKNDVDISASNGHGTVTLRPEPMVRHYTIKVCNVTNLSHAVAVGATISGMAGSLKPQLRTTGQETVTHQFTLYADSHNSLAGKLSTFGHCAGTPMPGRNNNDIHKLVLYAVLKDGSKWYSTRDVTQMIHGSPAEDCQIVIDGLELPETLDHGGGFTPEVSEWQSIDIDIDM